MQNSGLHRLISTNVAPSPGEAFFIRSRIDDIKSQAFPLHSHLNELGRQLRLCRAVLSAIRRMPGEILGEIFAHSLPDISQPGSRKHLVNIQLVCKSWRDAARLTHRLWGAVDLSCYDITHVSYNKVRQWLRRAGRTPKSLAYTTRDHINCSSDQSSGSQSVCGMVQSTALAVLLVSLEGTLDHLTLGYRGPQCFQNFLDALGAAAEGPTSLQRRSWHPLKSLTLKFGDEWSTSSDPLQSMFVHLPPHITSFELYLPSKWSNAFFVESDSDRAPLPLPQTLLEQLSSFTLGCDWEGTRWLDATLTHCVNVETLTLDFMGLSCDYSEAERTLSPKILLPKVQTLRLQNIYKPLAIPLFLLEAPGLVEFDIHFEPDEDSEEVYWIESEPFFSFITRSNCEATFRKLNLRNAHITTSELGEFLLNIPSLTHLSLDNVVVETGASSIEALIETEDDAEPPLPDLETLELLNLQPDFPSNQLLDFLESRIPYQIENGQPVFTNAQDPFKQLNVTYRATKEGPQVLDKSKVVEMIKKRGGVHLSFGPTFHVE